MVRSGRVSRNWRRFARRFAVHASLSSPRVAPRQIRVNCDSASQVTPSLTCGNASKSLWRWGESNPHPSIDRQQSIDWGPSELPRQLCRRSTTSAAPSGRRDSVTPAFGPESGGGAEWWHAVTGRIGVGALSSFRSLHSAMSNGTAGRSLCVPGSSRAESGAGDVVAPMHRAMTIA